MKDIYRNPRKTSTVKQANEYAEYIRKTHDDWYDTVSSELSNPKNLNSLPKNTLILTPSTPDGDFQVVEDGNPFDVLTFVGTEQKPIFSAPSGGLVAWGDLTGTITDQTDLVTYVNSQGFLTTETDPVFLASDAASISSSDITNWNNAFSWGDHSLAGYLTSETDPKRVVSLAFTGLGTKTLTLTLADATTVSNTFTDISGGGGGAIADGDYGDIVVSGAGSTFLIDDEYTNNLKMKMIAYAVSL